MKRIWLNIRVLATVGAALCAIPASAADFVTEAEASGFRATGSDEQRVDLARRLAATSGAMRLEFFGRSAEGRPLPVLVVSGSGAFTPAAAAASGKPILLIQSGIHAGEIDGKDASMMMLRDLALGAEPELLEKLILLVVPIYNVDGHERVSERARPNQNGPVEGMGFRTTTDGHDLNRDHLKLDTPEARAMIGLYDAWQPHLHVDNHVTNGSDHAWVLTYSWAEAPQIAPSVDAWLAEHMPRVVESTRALDHRLGPYVSLIDRTDPSKGFDSVVPEPRYATGYYALRNRPSILVENHAYKTFRQRVLANRDFLLALLLEIAEEPEALVDAVGEADARTVALGRPDADPSQIVLRYARAEPERIRFPAYDWYTETSIVTGDPLLRFRRGALREIEVPWVHRLTPELSVARPRGYLIPPGWPAIEHRLRDHGLSVQRLEASLELEVETMRIRPKDGPIGPSYQGRTQVDVVVARATERRSLPAGTLWVRADQPDFELAVQMLEPEAPDSLVHWGLLSSVMERKEYIGARALEPLVREMLADPAVASEWKHALEDESFAGNARARWLWWYRRTDYWDETVGLLPVFRLMSKPDFPSTAGRPSRRRGWRR